MSFALFREGQIWHYRFRVAGQPRVQRSTRETNRAKAALVASEAFNAAVLRARGEEPCPTLRELVPLWLEAHALVHSDSHLRSVEAFGRLHLYGLAELFLTEITTAHVERARSDHLAGHARASCNHWLTILRLLFRWAMDHRMIKIREWNVRLLKVQKRPRTMLPLLRMAEWLRAFDGATKSTLRLAVRMAMGLGLRESEAMGARWEWLDFDRGTYTPGRTKGREADQLPVPIWLLEELRPFAQPQGLIAPSFNGKPFTVGSLRQVMHRANARLGILGLTPHRLRGTYATLLSEAGVPIQDIQKALRHKNVATTMAYLEVDLNRVSRGQDSISLAANLGGRKSGAPAPSNA